MGFGFNLMFPPMALCVVALLGAQLLRRLGLLAFAAFSFGCLVWGGAVFACYAIVNEQVLQRDALIGDSWDCPLPNGYAISMIDVTDYGWVYKLRTLPVEGIARVSRLQVAGRYIAAGANRERSTLLSYFLIDTVSGTRETFPNRADLRAAVQLVGFELNLEPIHAIYLRYRFTGFDLFALVLLVVPPFLVLMKGVQSGSRGALGSPSRSESGL